MIAADAINTTDDLKVDKMIKGHFEALRRDPRYEDSYLPVFMETNSDWTQTKRVQRMICGPDSKIKNKDKIWFVSCDSRGELRVGVRTTDEEKRIGADELETALLDRSLCYAAGFICNTEHHSSLMKKKIETQMQNYRHEVKIPDDPVFGKVKHAWTGKAPGRRDDLCWVVQMCLLHSAALRKNREFMTFANRNGWLLA